MESWSRCKLELRTSIKLCEVFCQIVNENIEKHFDFFSTSDISYQMCYCCRKLEKLVIFNENRPQCTESASMYVQLSDWCTLRHSQSESCTLRPILYIEADSVHWGRIGLNVQYIEAEIIYFLMWSVWANQTAVHWGPANQTAVHWGQFCTLSQNQSYTLRPMYEIGLNVRNRPQCTVHWGRQSESCTLRLIPYFEADSVHWG